MSHRLHAQRWVYRLGNSSLIIDNAFTWSMWGQERMIINGETVKSAAAWMAVSRSFKEPWLSPSGEGEIRANIMGGLLSLTCELLHNGERLTPEACYSARWQGERGVWPTDIPWQDRPISHAIRFTKPRPSPLRRHPPA